MKKSLFLLAAALSSSVVVNAAGFMDNDYVKDNGHLKLVGNQLCNKDGQPIQLKGWSTFGVLYGEVSQCLGKTAFETMKNYGANVVRIADYASSNSGKGNSQSAVDKVKQCLDYCKDLGMYALVDWHVLDCDDGIGLGDPNKYTSEAKDFFTKIKAYVKENDMVDNVIYEICNEPSGVSWDDIKSYADQIVPILAAGEGEESPIVILGTPQWDQQIEKAVADRYRTKEKVSIMYAFHYYACSHGHLVSAYDNALANIPVFVSEWGGVLANGKGNFCESQSVSFLSHLDKNPNQIVSNCWWAWGEKNEASNTWNTCTGGYKASDMKPSGTFYANYLSGGQEIGALPVSEAYSGNQKIPGMLNVGNYDNGGPGVAYYDKNTSMYPKDKDGNTDYNGIPTEDWQSSAETGTYPNAGSMYANIDNVTGAQSEDVRKASFRSTEGVDMSHSCLGPYDPEVEGGMNWNRGWHNFCMIETGEWVNYQVDVKEAGFYKVKTIYNIADLGEVGIGLSIAAGKEGNIGQVGNIIRYFKSESDMKVDNEKYRYAEACLSDGTNPGCKFTMGDWACWFEGEMQILGEPQNTYVLFKYPGVQTLRITMAPLSGIDNPSATPGDFSNLTFEKVTKDIAIPAFEFQAGSDVIAADGDVDFSIAPNPTSGEFTVNVEGKANVSIYNALGAMVYNNNIEGATTINKNLVKGIYSVVVKSANGVKTKKLVVE